MGMEKGLNPIITLCPIGCRSYARQSVDESWQPRSGDRSYGNVVGKNASWKLTPLDSNSKIEAGFVAVLKQQHVTTH